MGLSNSLIKWYKENKRELPWRNVKDPYLIWLSEIILQQTRVNQGFQYYLRFAEEFPTVGDLASATMDKVLKLWQGLGYYSRARNMHQTAKVIVEKYQGRFPESYDELITLKGVGPYTAAAVASIAFGVPVPVVDGNVLRVFTRIYGISEDIRKDSTRRTILELSRQQINRKNASVYNQAVMEFGALQCVPVNPQCSLCPLNHKCSALHDNKVAEIPFKSPAKKQKSRYFHFLIVQNEGHIYMEQRGKKDIWHSLFQFPLIETTKSKIPDEVTDHDEWEKWFGQSEYELTTFAKQYRHVLSHQIIYARFHKIKLLSNHFNPPRSWKLVRVAELEKFPVPRLIDKFLQAYGQHL